MAKTNYVKTIKSALGIRIDVESDLLDLYTLLALVKGRDTTREDVHNAWAIWRNNSNPYHRALIPYDDLEPEIQQLDEEYAQAIREVAT